MTSLNYVTVTGTFKDGTGAPLTGTVTFTPSQTVYSAGVPLVTPGVPVTAEISNGQLVTPAGAPVTLLATDNAGLALEGRTGFWFWQVSVSLAGSTTDAWEFFLPWATYGQAPYNGTVDLYALANTVQQPTAASPLGTTAGGTGVSASTLAALLGDLLAAGGGTLGGPLAPKVVALSQAAGSVAVPDQGNVFTLALTASGWTIALPTGMADGQAFRLRLAQDATGGRTVSWASGWDWGSSGGTPNGAPALSTAPNAVDVLGFEWNAALGKAAYAGAAFPQGY